MIGRLRAFWWALLSRKAASGSASDDVSHAPTDHQHSNHAVTRSIAIATDDPLVAYVLRSPGALEVDKVDLDSPLLRELKAAGVKLTVPLVSQGELIGLLNLGPRLSEQDYSSDDRGLLTNLGLQAAPAVRVAQLVRQQQEEAAERERIANELRVARLIQQTLLPNEMPSPSGWEIAAHYQPAREVGGDFYDFLTLPNGQLGLVIADVSDKGMPAALVMATTRSALRAAAERLVAPGEVLKNLNEVVCADVPSKMFVTCFYAVLDPRSGRLRYANAGHTPPYRRSGDAVGELRATGVPLGLFPGVHYDEEEVVLASGDTVLFFSDGLVEAHDPRGEMLGLPRLASLVRDYAGDAPLIEFLLSRLAEFTGADWEQEDDVTLVSLHRSGPDQAGELRPVAELRLPSEAGNERVAMEWVVDTVRDLSLPAHRIERLKTAVAEATMNAIEHGNKYRADLLVVIEVLASDGEVVVRIVDQGNDPLPIAETPNLDAKLAGLQSPRGWGLFLIRNMVDELRESTASGRHTVELVLRRWEPDRPARR